MFLKYHLSAQSGLDNTPWSFGKTTTELFRAAVNKVGIARMVANRDHKKKKVAGESTEQTYIILPVVVINTLSISLCPKEIDFFIV